MSRPLRGNDTELRQMAAQRINRLGALAHQKIARPEQHAPSLLFLRLHSHKAHGRPRRRLADRLRIRRVVLLPLDVRFDVDRWDQSHRMAETADLPAPMVRAAARLHRHRAAWLRSHKIQQLRPAQLLAERNRPIRPRTVQLKAVLRQIDPDHVNLFHGRPLPRLALTTPPTWHIAMPSGGASTPSVTRNCSVRPWNGCRQAHFPR